MPPSSQVENVEVMPPNNIKFDFLGKDSIRYENTVEVERKVYDAVKQFIRMDAKGKKKAPDSDLFDAFDAQDLNKVRAWLAVGCVCVCVCGGGGGGGSPACLLRMLPGSLQNATVDVPCCLRGGPSPGGRQQPSTRQSAR